MAEFFKYDAESHQFFPLGSDNPGILVVLPSHAELGLWPEERDGGMPLEVTQFPESTAEVDDELVRTGFPPTEMTMVYPDGKTFPPNLRGLVLWARDSMGWTISDELWSALRLDDVDSQIAPKA